METSKPLKLTEIARRISAHLARFERTPEINKNTKPDRSGTSLYYNAGAYAGGRFVRVRYIGYQHVSSLAKDEALHYLAMLDAGYIGRHYEAFRKSPVPPITPQMR